MDWARIFIACGFWIFLEHGLDGLGTDFFSLRLVVFFWNTDWID
jgi:hypothetical protein